jgi:hypothetical protein
MPSLGDGVVTVWGITAQVNGSAFCGGQAEVEATRFQRSLDLT